MAKKNPWAFKINYDAAIADDQMKISQYERQLASKVFLPTKWVELGCCPEAHFVAKYEPAIAEAMGLSNADVLDLKILDSDFDFDTLPADYVRDFKRADALVKRLDTEWGWLSTEDKVRANLKKAKADLARHKRNKAKYGTT